MNATTAKQIVHRAVRAAGGGRRCLAVVAIVLGVAVAAPAALARIATVRQATNRAAVAAAPAQPAGTVDPGPGSGDGTNSSSEGSPGGNANPPDTGNGNGNGNPPDTGNANPPDTGNANPPDTGNANPPDTGNANPPDTGNANPPDTGNANPPDTGNANPPDTGNANPPGNGNGNANPPGNGNGNANPPGNGNGNANPPGNGNGNANPPGNGNDLGGGAQPPQNPDPPSVEFSFTPSAPVVGEVVTFTATTTRSDGGTPDVAWDFDNDGNFNDATGAVASHGFPSSGAQVVTVRATDPRTGASAQAFQTVTVRPAPVSSPPVTTPHTPNRHGHKARAAMISPFPIVRIRGRVFRKYTKFDVVSVLAPRKSRIRVSCSGRSCKRRASIAKVRRKRHWMRFRQLERRMPAGTVLQIFVTQRRRIGKYTRFEVRARKAPLRRDRCATVSGARVRVVRCPAG